MTPFDLSSLFTQWQFAPVVTAGLIITGGGYLIGVRSVNRRHPRGRWPLARSAAFFGGLLVVALATESSIGYYDDVLFSMHMVQHLALIMVAPPLLVLGRPVTLALHATRNPWHRRIRSVVRSLPVSVASNPVVAFVVYVSVIVGTHLTSFMQLVLTHPLVHDAEHLVYLLAGYLFFLPLLGSEPTRWRLSYPGRFLLLALAMPVDTFVGVVLTQATHEPWPAYLHNRPVWAGSALADLHAGGAVMWVGGDAVMFVLIFGTLLAFLADKRDPGTAGVWLEGVRRQTLAAHASGVGVRPAPARRHGTVDDNDADLAAYNAYLAALSRGRTGASGG